MPTDYLDNRKLSIILENKKQYDIVFSSLRHRLLFESAIYSILVISFKFVG